MAEKPIPTLYEWAGNNQEIFERLIETFYDKTLEDPLLEPFFRYMPKEHRRNVALWFAEIFGGPTLYSTEHGGHAHMVKAHMHLPIEEKHRQRWVQLMNEAADDVKLPDDPEFRSAFVAYTEWGTRMGYVFAKPGAKPPSDDSPMPIWGWGVVKPYIPD
jgi:hemoglobin